MEYKVTLRKGRMGCDWDGARAELLGAETGFCFVLLFLIWEVVTILCSLCENALG